MTSQHIFITSKKCPKCGEIKSKEDFYKSKDKKDGLYSYCKICFQILNKKNKQKNTIKYKIQDKIYREKHTVKIKEHSKVYRRSNPELIKERANKFRISHPTYRRNYMRIRRLNPTIKIYDNMRSNLYGFLKRNKISRTHEYVCCTPEELWLHLERQFKEGMTRENYGKLWHIDHIIPLQWFIDNDLMDETNKKIACHYGNLQPLFVQENLSKGDCMPVCVKFNYFVDLYPSNTK